MLAPKAAAPTDGLRPAATRSRNARASAAVVGRRGSGSHAPKELTDTSLPIALTVTNREERFLRSHLVGLQSNTDVPHDSLLARLVASRLGVAGFEQFWLPDVLSVAAPEDKLAIERARKASALSAVGRAVYAALLEQQRDDDGVPTEKLHRDHLNDVVFWNAVDAMDLDLKELHDDAPSLRPSLLRLLDETKAWLQAPGPPEDLLPIYESAEIRRKGARARLAHTPHARQLRREWVPEKYALAEGLHYRWRQVRRQLGDLTAVAT